MSPTRQELLSLYEQMDADQRQRLLEAARQILETPRTYTGLELMSLPPEERERLRAQARSTQELKAISSNNDSDTQK